MIPFVRRGQTHDTVEIAEYLALVRTAIDRIHTHGVMCCRHSSVHSRRRIWTRDRKGRQVRVRRKHGSVDEVTAGPCDEKRLDFSGGVRADDAGVRDAFLSSTAQLSRLV